MVFASHADGDYIEATYPSAAADDENGAVNLAEFRRERVKNKLRNGLGISASRSGLYKKLILHCGLDEADPITPIIDAENETLDGRELENYLTSCSVFDKSLMKFPWLSEQGHIVRNLILQRVQRNLPQVTWSPLLPLFVSVLLAFVESPDDVYRLVESFLINYSCPIARSANQAAADDNTLRDLALLKLKSDKIRAWVSQSPMSVTTWRIWMTKLPFPTLVTFVDCLLLEGPKIKFRFALAFLIMGKSMGYFDPDSGSRSISEVEAEEIVKNEKFDQLKIVPKAFGIKRLSWNMCGKLISRHKVLLELSAGGIGTTISAASRLSQTNAGEYFDQARNAKSDIVKVGDLARLIAILPPRYTVQQINKIMTTKRDGYSLRSVYNKIGKKSDILILIKPNRGQDTLFGAFLTGIEYGKTGCTGTGESFVFRIETEVESWIWTEGNPSLFACFDHSQLLVGNGSLSIDSDLKFCSTTQSEVFSNPNLLTKDDSFQTFEILHLELFSFTDYDFSE